MARSLFGEGGPAPTASNDEEEIVEEEHVEEEITEEEHEEVEE